MSEVAAFFLVALDRLEQCLEVALAEPPRPAALDDLGGWLNPDVRWWFADYAQVVFEALADRVPLWATINEPWVITDGGYLFGALAPGHRSKFETPIASHNILRSHGKAVQAFRAESRHRIGLVVNIEPKYPHSKRKADLDEAQPELRAHGRPGGLEDAEDELVEERDGEQYGDGSATTEPPVSGCLAGRARQAHAS